MSASSRTYADAVTGQDTQPSTEKVNFGFRTTQVPPYGDCLFHSLDIILKSRGISTSPAELRKNIAHLGLVTSEQHLNLVYSKAKARLLWLDMANKGVWDTDAGDQILAIASQYLMKPIIVISRNREQKLQALLVDGHSYASYAEELPSNVDRNPMVIFRSTNHFEPVYKYNTESWKKALELMKKEDRSIYKLEELQELLSESDVLKPPVQCQNCKAVMDNVNMLYAHQKNNCFPQPRYPPMPMNATQPELQKCQMNLGHVSLTTIELPFAWQALGGKYPFVGTCE